MATAQVALLPARCSHSLSSRFKARCSHSQFANSGLSPSRPCPARCPNAAPQTQPCPTRCQAATTGPTDRASPATPASSISVPVQGPYREHFQLLQKEVAILHILGSHPHILGLKEVLHADERLYLVTGGASGEQGCAVTTAVRHA